MGITPTVSVRRAAQVTLAGQGDLASGARDLQPLCHLAVTHADLSAVDTVAIDETSYKRGHNYLTLAADARQAGDKE